MCCLVSCFYSSLSPFEGFCDDFLITTVLPPSSMTVKMPARGLPLPRLTLKLWRLCIDVCPSNHAMRICLKYLPLVIYTLYCVCPINLESIFIKGQHYWYDISANMKCENFFPVFLLYNSKKLTGFGWAMQGDVKSPRVEHPTPDRLHVSISM